MAPQQCFLSYSHADHPAFLRLCKHMGAVSALYGLKIWHDERISGGSYWNDKIKLAVEESQIFIALLTNDYFASDYILYHELPAMLERHRNHNALVLPLVYRESCWRGFFGSYIQVIPGRKGSILPISDWKPAENGFASAANATCRAIEDWFGVKPNSPLGLTAP